MAEPKPETVKVTAIVAVAVSGKYHPAGSTFTAPVGAVRDAVARGLVEPVRQR